MNMTFVSIHNLSNLMYAAFNKKKLVSVNGSIPPAKKSKGRKYYYIVIQKMHKNEHIFFTFEFGI